MVESRLKRAAKKRAAIVLTGARQTIKTSTFRICFLLRRSSPLISLPSPLGQRRSRSASFSAIRPRSSSTKCNTRLAFSTSQGGTSILFSEICNSLPITELETTIVTRLPRRLAAFISISDARSLPSVSTAQSCRRFHFFVLEIGEELRPHRLPGAVNHLELRSSTHSYGSGSWRTKRSLYPASLNRRSQQHRARQSDAAARIHLVAKPCAVPKFERHPQPTRIRNRKE